MSNIVIFSPNVPQQLSLVDPEGQYLSGRFSDQVFYQLSDGREMVVSTDVAAKINMLELKPGESFSICKQWDGNPRHLAEWNVWLAPQSEKLRAAAEKESVSDYDLEEQLRLSIEQAKARAIPQRKPPTPERSQPQAIRGTGTHGPAPQPQPVAVAASSPVKVSGKIPYNLAFREILRFVTAELKATGEQWNDQAKQDLVSTCFIASAKAGMLAVWEREGK